MKNLSIIYAIVSLVLMFLFIFLFFRKAENHFKLLKILFPKELEKIESYFDLGFGFQSVKLGIEISFWFYFPIFFVTKRVRLDERENVISLCKILIKNNIKILLSFIVFSASLFANSFSKNATHSWWSRL